MRAAIAGDIAGSRFERSVWAGDSFGAARCTGYDRPTTTDATGERAATFDLFHPDCHVTDDTDLTIAVMDWLLSDGELRAVLRAHFRRSARPDRFGRLFREWAALDTDEPCGSVGNGAAMRVSPVAFVSDDPAQVLRVARESALATHQTPDAVAGSEAVALGVLLARTAHTKEQIREAVAGRFGYDLLTPLDDIRPGYTFSSGCAETVPVALRAFLEADDYEGSVRRAVSVGGDSDTIACMAGALAGAFWGIPAAVAARVEPLLAADQLAVLRAFEARFPESLLIAAT
jgi:ADP-ribosylglycohydrolase